jgi:hypothetical protein
MERLSVYLTSCDASEKTVTTKARKLLLLRPDVLLTDLAQSSAVLIVDDAYLSIKRAIGIYRQFGARPVIVHFETDWPLAVFPGCFPSLVHAPREATLLKSWSYLASCRAQDWYTPAPPTWPYLFSFIGRANTHRVRSAVVALHSPSTPCLDVLTAPSFFGAFDYGQTYCDTVSKSAFVLCPRGFGSSSIRIFEAMAAGRVPVIISNDWIPPPVGDWGAFSVRVKEADVTSIPSRLMAMEGQAAAMGAEARRIFLTYFSKDRFFDPHLDIARRSLRNGKLTLIDLVSCNRWSKHLRSGIL